jgi:hypothetical protein
MRGPRRLRDCEDVRSVREVRRAVSRVIREVRVECEDVRGMGVVVGSREMTDMGRFRRWWICGRINVVTQDRTMSLT